MRTNWLYRTPVILAALAFSGQAFAQAAANSEDGEIIVTAQKREQKLSDVPVTIAAATGEQLRSAGVADITDLGKIAPSFTVAASTYGYQVFSIRGINFNSQQVSAAPAVSVYVDEAVIPYSAMTGALMLDVERIEVLKGPQGTLFGQNATGGSINVIAAKPTHDLAAGFRTEVNHFGRVMAEGYISGPVSETLRARLSAQTTQFGAYQRGYYLSDRKNGDQDKSAARLLLDWTPTDRLSVMINLNANYDRGEVIQPQLALVVPANPANAQPGLIGYPVANDNRDAEITPGFDTRARRHMYQAVGRIDYDLTDDLRLTSITSYASFRSKTPVDYDGQVLDNSKSIATGNVDSFNQEIRLTGTALDGRANFVFGGNYSNDKIDDDITSILNNYSALVPGSVYSIIYDVKNKSAAVFGNVEFELAPRLKLSAGARYTEAKQALSGCLYGNAQFNGLLGFLSGAFRGLNGLGPVPAGAFAPGTCATINDTIPNVANPNGTGLVPDFLPVFTDRSRKEHNVSWRASLNYKPTDDSLLYALVSRGYKAGVFPAQPNLLDSEASPVKQEELTSFEVGAKLAAFDRKLRLNVSAFHYDYKDKQFYTYLPVPVIGISSFVINIPKSKVNGVDADVVFNPVDALTVRGAVTYIDSKVKNFSAINGFGVLTDVSGKEFNYAPKWSGSFDVEYKMPAGDGLEAYIGGGGQFSGRSYSDLGEQAASRNPSYVLLDARIGLISEHGWRFGLFGRNLTDKFYWTSIYYTGDEFSRYAGQPRTFGASAAFTF